MVGRTATAKRANFWSLKMLSRFPTSTHFSLVGVFIDDVEAAQRRRAPRRHGVGHLAPAGGPAATHPPLYHQRRRAHRGAPRPPVAWACVGFPPSEVQFWPLFFACSGGVCITTSRGLLRNPEDNSNNSRGRVGHSLCHSQKQQHTNPSKHCISDRSSSIFWRQGSRRLVSSGRSV